MQTFKLLTLSLLIGATLQAWDGPIDYLYYGITGGAAKLPSQIAEDRIRYKLAHPTAEELVKESRKSREQNAAIDKAKEVQRQEEINKRDQKADILSLIESETLTPGQINFLAKQAKLKNTKIPEWYNNIIETDGKVIGYGSSENVLEASHRAQSEIAMRLSSTISSEDISKKSEVNGKYSASFTSEVKVESAKLNTPSFRTIKTEYLTGVFFVAIEYDTRELSEKIINLREKLIATQSPNYLNNSNFGKKLNKILGFDPELILNFNMGQPMLSIGDETYWLSEYELEQFFSNISTGTVKSSLSKELYRYNERVDLSITSSEQGYINVLWVGPDGVTGVIRENEKIYNSSQVMNYKNIDDGSDYLSEHKELLVTIFSKTPIDVSEFRFKKIEKSIRITLTQKFNQHKFHKLMEFMKDYQHCTSVAEFVHIGRNLAGQVKSKDKTGIVYAE